MFSWPLLRFNKSVITGSNAGADVRVGRGLLAGLLVVASSTVLIGCEVRGASDYLISGNEAFKRNDYHEAEKDYRNALRIEPNSSTALNNLGVILNELGRYDESAQILGKAVQVDPNNEIAHYTLAQALLKIGKYDEAMSEARAAIGLKDSDMHGHRALAEAALLKAEKDKDPKVVTVAVDEYHSILQADQDDDQAHENLGSALALQGDKEAALSEEKKAVELNPDNLTARKQLARFLHEQGNNADAIKELDAVIQKDGSDQDARKLRSEIQG
ncbi:MAG TPA: tetratricopeptide repeat protein [Candidatus Obscuribacterales bacterium]